MARTFARRSPDLREARVLVVGLGRSGLAAARLALAHGARVLIADRRSESELAERADEARSLGAGLHAGGHPAELVDDRDLIVASPGVPLADPLFARARARGIPVWGEVELASRYCTGRVVAITGSNGKSTVTSMTGTILRGAGLPGGTGGNLDVPLADLLALDGEGAVHAVELSSFQLESIDTFRPDVAAVVNLSPDHLDRYESFDAYGEAKARLLDAQDGSGAAVLNADDSESRRFRPHVRGRLFEVSVQDAVEHGGFVRDGRLVLRTEYGEEMVLPREELPVPGDHNVTNALIAALACRLVGCPVEAIGPELRAYRALPHRLERVADVAGVEFYDDSKATNVDSAARAIGAFAGRRVHVILGGRDKGADWRELRRHLHAGVVRVLLVGEAAPVIRRAFEGAVALVDCGSIEEAVRQGFRGATPGDVVLLSPACASFDQYANFEERGLDFRRAVAGLDRGGR